VRCLAAETFGFLLRAASRKSLRAGMRALLAEHAGETCTGTWTWMYWHMDLDMYWHMDMDMYWHMDMDMHMQPRPRKG
jgi:hypothetical protein